MRNKHDGTCDPSLAQRRERNDICPLNLTMQIRDTDDEILNRLLELHDYLDPCIRKEPAHDISILRIRKKPANDISNLTWRTMTALIILAHSTQRASLEMGLKGLDLKDTKRAGVGRRYIAWNPEKD